MELSTYILSRSYETHKQSTFLIKVYSNLATVAPGTLNHFCWAFRLTQVLIRHDCFGKERSAHRHGSARANTCQRYTVSPDPGKISNTGGSVSKSLTRPFVPPRAGVVIWQFHKMFYENIVDNWYFFKLNKYQLYFNDDKVDFRETGTT